MFLLLFFVVFLLLASSSMLKTQTVRLDGNLLFRWESYSDADCELLEKSFCADEKKITTTALSFASATYEFDFVAMEQINCASGTRRKLRRISSDEAADSKGDPIKKAKTEADDEDLDEGSGYAKLVRRSSAEWSKAKPTKVKGKAKDLSDESEEEVPKTRKPATKKERKMTKRKSHVKPSTVEDEGEDDTKTGITTRRPLHPKPPPLSAAEIKTQAALGAQSARGLSKVDFGPIINGNKHALACFQKLLKNEERLCGEWAVFYHSYSLAALLYEVQAAVAAVLFRFKSTFASLPRLLMTPYHTLSNASDLMAIFPKLKGQDHNPEFRAVAICASTSLVSRDPEATPKDCFLSGYSCSDLSFIGVLEQLLKSCHVPVKSVKALAKAIVSLSEKHGLDVSQFKGKRCASGKSGHLLQIFIKREMIDQYLYSAHPFGVVDGTRMPTSSAMGSDDVIVGQVRIVCNPQVFMRATLVRMFTYSADPTFHANRAIFQEELTALLEPIVGTDELRETAARGIMGGELPTWFSSSDQSEEAKITNRFR